MINQEEWIIEAINTLFANKIKRLKKITNEDALPLREAVFNYAHARQISLQSRLKAEHAAPALLGQFSVDDKLTLANRLILSYGCNPSDILQVPQHLFDADFKSAKMPRNQTSLF